MPTKQEKCTRYIVACINEFARQKKLDRRASFRYLYNNKGIAFLKEHYEIVTVKVSRESHFNSFVMNDVVYGAVGAWESANEFEFLIYCAELDNGYRVTLNFKDDGLVITTRSTYPESGRRSEISNPIEFTLVK